jgi:hypothetical protein
VVGGPERRGRDVPGLTGSSRWIDALDRRPRWVITAYVVVVSPLVFLGPGTDPDTFAVRAAASSIRHGSYELSRPPGAPVHELLVALAGPLGLWAQTALALLAAAVVLGLVLDLARLGAAPRPVLAVLVVASNPYFVIASTSLSDHIWTLAGVLAGIDLAVRRKPGWAGLAFGLAIGTRLVAAVPVVCVIGALALLAIRRREPRAARAAMTTALVAAAVAALAFLPVALTAGSSALENPEAGFPGLRSAAGAWFVKNFVVLGLLGLAFVALAVWRRGSSSPPPSADRARLLVACVAVVVAFESIFVRFPWKNQHLLTAAVAVALLLVLVRGRAVLPIVVLVALQLLWGVVGVRTVVPNTLNDASGGGAFRPALVQGPLLTDIRCRSRALDRALTYEEAIREWGCTNAWWRGSAANPDLP